MSQPQFDLSTHTPARQVSDNETLCSKLLRSDSEPDVVGILTEAGYWDDASSWRPYGDLSNNYGTIGNQQSEAVAALVEKIVNAIDARLTNECLVRGENPESPSAPQSIRESVHRYFGAGGQFDPDRSGRLSNWTDADLNTQGDFITVTATGHRPEGRRTRRGNHPCLTVADQGEGQTPGEFPNTFLSLHRNNKIRTKFVQGKFNMGATGALPYCSERYNLQLIISRRNPALVSSATIDRDLEWGFTIVRRRDPDEESRSSVFEYLAPVKFDGSQSGGVLSFSADRYPIFPDRNGPYDRMAEYGSLIKLYEYRWQGTTSSIIMPSDGAGLIRRIEIALAEPALPFKLYECRGYQSNENFRSARGILTDLDRNPGDLEAGFPQSVDLAIGKHRVMLRIFAFKPGGYSSHRTTRHGIIFLYNGQLHAAYPTRFFSRQSVRKAHIANDLLVTVDCSNLDRRDFEDLFMNSRDRLRSDSKLTTELERKIAEFLISNESLRELEYQRRAEAIASKIDDDQSREQLLKQLLDDNPDLSRYLLEGGILVRPGVGSRADSNGRFVGKQFPTYFDPKRREWNVGTGKKAQLEFDTDAENAYFDRSVSHGTWSIVDDDGDDWTNYWDRTGPRDGIVRFYWDTSSLPPSFIKPGQVFLFNVSVNDDSRQEPLSNEIMLTVTEPVETPGGGGGRRREGATESVKLPNIYHVYEAEWSSHPLGPFTNKTAVRIAPDSSTPNDRSAWDFFVNVDNQHVHRFSQRKALPLEVVRQGFSTASVFLALSLIRARADDDAETSPEAHDPTDDVARVSEFLAPVLLPVIDAIQLSDRDDSEPH